MAISDELLNKIAPDQPADEATYPHVARLSEPLLLRIDATSLLVNDTLFYAKIKMGLASTGYEIYSSGLGTPIVNNTFPVYSNGSAYNTSVRVEAAKRGFDIMDKNAEAKKSELINKAKKYLDDLEIEIASQVNDNPIKAAIDRLNWQQHYDTTGSNTDFVETFEDNDFADVRIDTYTETNELSTIPTTVDTIKKQISKLDKNLNWNVEPIEDDDQPLGSIVTVKNSISDLDDKLNRPANLQANPKDLGGTLYYIGRALKADDDKFTISKALREDGQDSVSKATDTAGTNIVNSVNAVNTSVGSVNSTLGTTNSNLNTIDGRLHVNSTNIASLTDNIKDTSSTISGRLYDSNTGKSVASAAAGILTTTGNIERSAGDINTSTTTIMQANNQIVSKLTRGSESITDIVGSLRQYGTLGSATVEFIYTQAMS